jgi:hypothetical protein
VTGGCGSRWLACLLLLAPGPALAEQVSDAGVTLDWRAPSGCPNGSAVLAKVRALVSAAAAERVTARAIVDEPTAGVPWHLTLETVQGARTWQRNLHAATCDELADAGALIVALVLDPNLEVGHGAASATPSAGTPGTTQPSAAQASAPGPPAEQRPVSSSPPAPVVLDRPMHEPATTGTSSALVGHVVAAAVGDWGSLPGIAPGAELGAGAGIDPIELELSALILPPMREVIAENPERGGEITLVAGGLRGCYALGGSKLSGRLCGGLEAGRIQGTGFGTSGFTDVQSSLWIAGRLGIFGRYPLLPPLGLRFGLEGVVPGRRPEFTLVNVGTVHRPNITVVRLALGFELLFR